MPVTTNGLKFYWNPKNATSGATTLANIAPAGVALNVTASSASVDSNGVLFLSSGSSGSLSVPYHSTFSTAGSWTFEYVYTPTVLMSDAAHKMWEAENASAVDRSIGYVSKSASTGSFYYDVYDGAGAATRITASVAEVASVQKIHLMVVHDATAGTITTFVNGLQKQQTTIAARAFRANTDTTVATVFNNSSTSIALNFQALRFYDRALTSAERTDNFNNGIEIGLSSPDTTAPANVTNVTATSTQSAITLNWTNPADSDFSHVQIHRTGTFIGTNITNGTFTDTGLQAGTEYSYNIQSIDTSGNISSGVISYFSTTSASGDTTPPAEVTNLSGTPSSTSIALSWTNPTTSDFSHVRILRGGVQVANNVTGGTYTDSGLTASTQYNYTVKTVDTTGNESAGTVGTYTTSSGTPASTPLTTDALKFYWNPKNASSGATTLTNIAPSGVTHDAVISASSVDASGVLTLAGGKTSYVTVNHHADYTTRGSWTMEYLFEPTTAMSAGSHKLWEAEDASGGTDDALMNIVDTGSIDFLVFDAALAQSTITVATTEVTTVQPIHLMVIHDATAGTLTVYVNGNQRHTQSIVPVSMKIGTTSPFLINESASSIALKFQALRFYHKALTSTERTNNFSNGTAIGLTAPADTTPPAEVTNLAGSPTSASITLSWTKPTTTDFSHVRILRNGTQVATNLTGTTYTDSGLAALTTYNYTVKTVDTTGNESTGVAGSYTTLAGAIAVIKILVNAESGVVIDGGTFTDRTVSITVDGGTFTDRTVTNTYDGGAFGTNSSGSELIPVYSITGNETQPLRIMTDEGMGYIPLVLTTDPKASRARIQTPQGIRALKKQ